MSRESNKSKAIFEKNREKMVHQNLNESELITSTTSEDSYTPLSETVTTLASNVYKQLERIIKNFGENSVKDLMPVMISILESLDNALHEREVGKLEIESLKEQTEQLFQQYEREKSFHKEYQQRYLQTEDHLEEIKRENEEKLRSLESIVKIFEIKSRNASDHVGRLEEKENEMKQEYKRLHDRYCELFKAHCDYMERTKILYGTDRLDPSNVNSNTNNRDKQLTTTDEMILMASSKESESNKNFDSILETTDGKHTQTESMSNNDAAVNTGIFSKLRSLNLLSEPFDEQQFFVNEDEFTTDPAAVSDDDDKSIDETKNLEAFDKETRNENIDITDVDASADLFVRQSFYGMTKEVSNLIKENNELLETKNALNVLKDDLLAKIEELSNEQEILREEVNSLQTVRNRLQTRITEVEEELRTTRETLEKKKEEEENVPTADRKRFTRVEMQRVLLERNQYKQRLFELEEAVHRHDALRASKYERLNPLSTTNDYSFDNSQNKNRPKFMKFFSSLFGSNTKESSPKRSLTSNTVSVKHTTTYDQIAPTSSKDEILTNENHSNDQRIEINGWSLSSNIDENLQINVPRPIYFQPLFKTKDGTQMWCAVGIDLSGLSSNIDETSVDQLNKQLIESYHQMIDEECLKLSSIVWIAGKLNDSATITIVDSNQPDKIIDTFTLGNAILYAMGSVPGSSTTDFPPFDDLTWKDIISSTNDVKVTSCTAASLSADIHRSNVSETSEQIINENKTKFPTVWLGSSDGWLYIHSAIAEHRTTIGKIWLHHAIYSIVHIRGRVFVSLANEKIVVFHRNIDGTWNLNDLHLIITGKTRESVRCVIHVEESIWCGVANRICVIDSRTLEIRKQFEVHSRPEHSVQHMTWSGDGVWLSVRLSSTLQLYHTKTCQRLQEVDIQPYIEKMLVTEKAGLYFVHISALTIACRRLWIGTGNGIIISVPLIDNNKDISPNDNSNSAKPGSVVRINDQISSSNYIPYCSMNNAQLSYHGYHDAVKFFVAVPGQGSSKSIHDNETTSEISTATTTTSPFGDILIVSGGDGYMDFRIGHTPADINDDATDSNRYVSYIIVWHLGSL